MQGSQHRFGTGSYTGYKHPRYRQRCGMSRGAKLRRPYKSHRVAEHHAAEQLRPKLEASRLELRAAVPLTRSDVAGAGSSCRSATAARAGASDVVYHYTTTKHAATIQRTGLWSQSSATDVGMLTAQETVERLGVKTPPEVVIEIRNEGRFVPNKPTIVQPHPLGPGGGIDLTKRARVPPECVVCVRPVGKP
jgi:hypothetical protein